MDMKVFSFEESCEIVGIDPQGLTDRYIIDQIMTVALYFHNFKRNNIEIPSFPSNFIYLDKEKRFEYIWGLELYLKNR
jgi:hypothetical protein